MTPNPKIKRQEDKAYLEYIKTRSCVVSDVYTRVNCIGDVVPHHTTTKGAGGSDHMTIPLCMHHHQLIHQIGRYSFQNTFGMSFKNRIIQLLKAYPKQNAEIKELLKKLEAE